MTKPISQCKFCAAKDAEIEKLKAHVWEAEAERDMGNSLLPMTEAERDELQDENKELKAEIQHLRTTFNMLTTSANAVIEQRDELRNKVSVLNKNLIETTDRAMIAEVQRDEADHRNENLLLRLDQLNEYKEIWYKRALESLDQRDEARRVAWVLYDERNAMSLGLDVIKRHTEQSVHNGIPMPRLGILEICRAGLKNLSYTRNLPPTSRGRGE